MPETELQHELRIDYSDGQTGSCSSEASTDEIISSISTAEIHSDQHLHGANNNNKLPALFPNKVSKLPNVNSRRQAATRKSQNGKKNGNGGGNSNGGGEGKEEESIISKLSPIKIPSSPITPYTKLTKAMTNDTKWAKDVALGKRIALYRIKGELGSGNFSQVKMAIHQLTAVKVAIKTLDSTKLDAKAQRMLRREIAIMEQLCHPNLIQLFEVVETRSSVHLVMEMADEGELFAKITNDGRMTEEKSRLIFSQIISGVDYMHSRNVIHRDLKAENIYFKRHETIKVGDFGFSTEVNYMDEALRTFCGSPPYAAPELFQEESYVGAPVDIWALGVLLYFMVCGYMPFRASTVIALKNSILKDDYEIPPHVSEECANLIRGILRKDHRQRFTMADVVSSVWLASRPPDRPLVARRPSGQRPISGKGVPSRWMYHPWPVLDRDQRSPLEKECRSRMSRYGLNEEHIEKALPHGCRDPVIGIYRMTAHLIHGEMLFKSVFTFRKVDETDENVSSEDNNKLVKPIKLKKASEIVSNKRKSRTCSIL